MRLRFGRYAGMTTEALVLRRPDYVVWMLREAPDGAVGRDFAGLIKCFDARLRGDACAACLAPPGQSDLVVVDPAEAETLVACGFSRVGEFWDAVAHVERSVMRSHRRVLRRLVRNLAITRGAPRRFTDGAAFAFLRNRAS